MADILIHSFDPPGEEVALFNEDGLQEGSERYISLLNEMYDLTHGAIEDTTVYAVAMRGEDDVVTPWGKAYIDFTPYDFCRALARLAGFMAQPGPHPQADLSYSPEGFIHLGIWVTPRRWPHIDPSAAAWWKALWVALDDSND